MTTILRRFRDWRARIKRRLADRLDLLLEHLALRHQLMVCERGRRIRGTDRLGWCLLARFWSRWREPLTFVEPATVLRWRRTPWWWHLRWRRRSLGGRPRIDRELQALIRRMAAENGLWGSMRIVGVLRPLGFKVRQFDGAPVSVSGQATADARMNPLFILNPFLHRFVDGIWGGRFPPLLYHRPVDCTIDCFPADGVRGDECRPNIGHDTLILPDGIVRALHRLADEIGLTRILRLRLMELACGLSYQDISERNAISVNTVKSEVRTVLGRLGVPCRHEIDHAISAATQRASAGSGSDQIYRFLCLRFE